MSGWWIGLVIAVSFIPKYMYRLALATSFTYKRSIPNVNITNKAVKLFSPCFNTVRSN